MPLGARELLLIVRARDVATRVLRDVEGGLVGIGTAGKMTGRQVMQAGAAMTAAGVALGAAGAAGLAFFNDATDAAIEYNRQAALTKTQVDDVNVSVKQLADVGRDVAREIPAPFDQMQSSLYDIFSSMDVNVKGAKQLLTEFSRAAVAGQVDIQGAARSTISIMNAYKLPVSDVGHILDVMFQLVRKGVGTYDEFNSSIGRTIPAAVAAGQGIETMAGMMAFLTRNGLSTQMAATSAARAMELFADPKRFHALEELGITVRDSSGKFLQMNDIVTQLANNEGWAKMSEPKRKEMFKEIFGTGSIQARRFFDTAIPNFEQLNALTMQMYGSTGAMDQAYKTMFDEPSSKAQLLTNQYQILKTEIGDQLIPIKLKLMEHVQKLLDWWNKLDDGTKNLIIKIGFFTSIALVAAGVILTVVGVVTMLVGGIMLLGFSLGGAIALIGGVVVGLIAAGAAIYGFISGNKALLAILAVVFTPITLIVGAIYMLVTHFDDLKKAAISAWNKVKEWSGVAWQAIQKFWDWLTSHAVAVWHGMRTAAIAAWNGIKAGASDLWGWLKTAWAWFDEHFGDGFRKIWHAAQDAVVGVAKEIGETFTTMAGRIKDAWDNQIFPVLDFFGARIVDLWPIVVAAFNIIKDTVVLAFGIVVEVVKHAVNVLMTDIEFAVGVIIAFWQNFGDNIINIITYVWDFVSSVVSAAITIISNIIQLFLNIIQGDWGEAWNNIKNIFKAAWDAIYAALVFVGRLIREFVTRLPGDILRFIGNVGKLLWQKGVDIMNSLWDGIKATWNNVKRWVGDIKDHILDFFKGARDWLYNAGKSVLQGFFDGLKAKWQDIKDFVGGIDDWVKDHKGPPAADRVLLVDNGKLIMDGLYDGLQRGWKPVQDLIMQANKDISNLGGMPTLGLNTYGGFNNSNQNVMPYPPGPTYGLYVENLNVRDENTVNDLNWWWETKNAGV